MTINKLLKAVIVLITLICIVLLVIFVLSVIYTIKDSTPPESDTFLTQKELLEQSNKQYDSFIISNLSPTSDQIKVLNKYLKADFYNIFVGNNDMNDTYHLAKYVVENYDTKNIILNIALSSQYNDKDKEQIKQYDLREQDVEHIGDIETYLDTYTEFSGKSGKQKKSDLNYEKGFFESLYKIRALCNKNDVKLIITCSPVYHTIYNGYTQKSLNEFYTKLAAVSDYWDFSISDISFDPRYFYNPYDIRNDIINMMINRIYGNKDDYYPGNFGYYVNDRKVPEHINKIKKIREPDDKGYTKEIPILLYHHISDTGDPSTVISEENFKSHIKAFSEAGYTSVSFDEIIDYVYRGKRLPDKPLCITFDDGYLSNYEIAYPILKEYNMKATIFVIGFSVGKDKYKDTDHPITPHFNYTQAKEMIDSGLISILSHTYDLHQYAPFESNTAIRANVLRLKGESEGEYVKLLTEDFNKISKEILKGTGKRVDVVAYPGGILEPLSEVVFRSLGVKVTLSTKRGTNTIIKGLPQSLYSMYRFNVHSTATADEVLSWLD